MVQSSTSIVRQEVYDPLAAALAKVPQERQGKVRRDAAIFIAGMEAAERTAQGVHAGA